MKPTPPTRKGPATARAEDIICAFEALKNAEQAKHLMRFFKTGPGQYGEGDVFLGLKVPDTRAMLKQFPAVSLSTCRTLLASPYHEVRLFALLAMCRLFAKGTPAEQEKVYRAYLKSAARINNWDLVDLSAPNIAGEYWVAHPEPDTMKALARSPLLWERRIAIIGTFAHIRRLDFKPTLILSKMLLDDPHDLMHKATGWMLREAGKRDRRTLLRFLDQHAHHMPRTALRYSIEHLDPDMRKLYLAQTKRRSS